MIQSSMPTPTVRHGCKDILDDAVSAKLLTKPRKDLQKNNPIVNKGNGNCFMLLSFGVVFNRVIDN